MASFFRIHCPLSLPDYPTSPPQRCYAPCRSQAGDCRPLCLCSACCPPLYPSAPHRVSLTPAPPRVHCLLPAHTTVAGRGGQQSSVRQPDCPRKRGRGSRPRSRGSVALSTSRARHPLSSHADRGRVQRSSRHTERLRGQAEHTAENEEQVSDRALRMGVAATAESEPTSVTAHRESVAAGTAEDAQEVSVRARRGDVMEDSAEDGQTASVRVRTEAKAASTAEDVPAVSGGAHRVGEVVGSAIVAVAQPPSDAAARLYVEEATDAG